MSLGTMEDRTEGIKKQAQTLIDQAYQHGYKKAEEEYHIQSLKDRDSSYKCGWECGYEFGIEQGRNEAWECVRKIAQMPTEISEPIFNQFGLHNIMANYSASEAIDKLRAYEAQKQKEDSEIHVGDEVLDKWGIKGIVLEITPQCTGKIIYSVLWRSTARKCWDKDDWDDFQIWKKTGRTFPEIVEVLVKMKEGDDK